MRVVWVIAAILLIVIIAGALLYKNNAEQAQLAQAQAGYESAEAQQNWWYAFFANQRKPPIDCSDFQSLTKSERLACYGKPDFELNLGSILGGIFG